MQREWVLRLFCRFKYLSISLLGGKKTICRVKTTSCNSWASDAHTRAERDKGCQPHLSLGSCNFGDWDTYFPRPALILFSGISWLYPIPSVFLVFSLPSLQFSFTAHPLFKPWQLLQALEKGEGLDKGTSMFPHMHKNSQVDRFPKHI